VWCGVLVANSAIQAEQFFDVRHEGEIASGEGIGALPRDWAGGHD